MMTKGIVIYSCLHSFNCQFIDSLLLLSYTGNSSFILYSRHSFILCLRLLDSLLPLESRSNTAISIHSFILSFIHSEPTNPYLGNRPIPVSASLRDPSSFGLCVLDRYLNGCGALIVDIGAEIL